MSLDSIVNVQITRETKTDSQAGFGIALIFGINKAFSSLQQLYASTSAVLEDFNSNSKEYKAAVAAFSQNPAPSLIAIGRRKTSDISTVTVATVANSSLYTITINGTAFTFTSDADATNLEIAAGLVADINGGSEPVTAVDVLDGTFTVDADVAGVVYTLTTDTKLTVAYATAQTIAEDMAEMVEESDDFYGVMYTERTEADVLALAAWTETVKKVFGTASDDADIIDLTLAADTGSIVAQFKALSYARSFCFYHALAASEYPEAALFGTILPEDPGSYTAMFKTLTGITVDTLSESQQANALAKNCNIYILVGGVNIVKEGKVAEGEYIDIIVFVDWLDARMTERIYGVLVNQKKVPFTDPGITAIDAEMQAQLQEGIDVGGLAADPAPTTFVPKAIDVSAADKGNRLLRNATFSGTLAGAIHAVQINGTVSL